VGIELTPRLRDTAQFYQKFEIALSTHFTLSKKSYAEYLLSQHPGHEGDRRQTMIEMRDSFQNEGLFVL
jgi:hypothetical protein